MKQNTDDSSRDSRKAELWRIRERRAREWDERARKRLPEINPELAAKLAATEGLVPASADVELEQRVQDLEQELNEARQQLEGLQHEHPPVRLHNPNDDPDPNSSLHSTYGDGYYDAHAGDV